MIGAKVISDTECQHSTAWLNREVPGKVTCSYILAIFLSIIFIATPTSTNHIVNRYIHE